MTNLREAPSEIALSERIPSRLRSLIFNWYRWWIISYRSRARARTRNRMILRPLDKETLENLRYSDPTENKFYSDKQIKFTVNIESYSSSEYTAKENTL